MDVARRQAMMGRSNDDSDPLGPENLVDRASDLGRHFFLYLQTPGIGFHDARELANSDDAAARNAANPGATMIGAM
jgi:hypothetical protein